MTGSQGERTRERRKGDVEQVKSGDEEERKREYDRTEMEAEGAAKAVRSGWGVRSEGTETEGNCEVKGEKRKRERKR